MTPTNRKFTHPRRLAFHAGALVFASSLLGQPTAPEAPAPQPPKKDVPVEPVKSSESKDDAIMLTPFTVDATKDKGYYAENTLAGSRLNTNLADLGASISVVTKQQLEDTGSLDINDVFKYESNTEGSSSYTPVVTDRGTAKDTISGYTLGNDGGTTTNAQSNRVRGLGAPDAAINYFSTNPRVPFDSYNTQSVEISRGPNSLLFGLGNPAGIVNQTAAQAALNRDTNTVSLRTDQYGSRRGSFTLNRSLIDDKLAIYVAALYNNQQFERKPSYDLTRRQYGALTFKPFSKTVIRGFVENYDNNANRPNFLTPRDFVTPWIQAGRPAYDPIARTVTVLSTGTTYGPYVLSTLSPGYVSTANGRAVPANGSALTATTSGFYVPGIQFDDITRPIQYIDGGEQALFFQRQPVLSISAWTNPAQTAPTPANQGWVAQDARYAILDRQWASSVNLPIPTTTINGTTYTYGNYQLPGVTNKAIYDWTKYNTNESNFGELHATNYNLELEQQILPNLFFTAGWLRQDIDSAENYTISQTTGATIQIDANLKLPNGQPNPYFGLPYVSDSAPDTFFQPEVDDNFRAMLAYDLDLTKQDNFLKYFGRHRILGLWSEQSKNAAVERWRLGFHSGDTAGSLRYLPNPLLNNGWNIWNASNRKRNYYLASPGDPLATVTQSTGFYGNKGWQTPYTTQIEVYNYATSRFEKVTMTEQIHFSDAGSFRRKRDVKSWNIADQAYLFDDRLIVTAGFRRDDFRLQRTQTGRLADGTAALTAAQIYSPTTGEANYNLVMNRWDAPQEGSGDTITAGFAARIFKGWSFIERPANQGSVLADFVRNITLYYNQSENFNPPATVQGDYFFRLLPLPTGEGKDIGVGFSAFNNKLVARVSWFETKSHDERTSAAGTLLTRLAYGDTTLMQPWAETVVRLRNGANPAVANWNTNTVNPVTSTALQQQVWDLMKLPVNYYSGVNVGGTQETEAKGAELSLTYNPVPNWTMKLTGAKTETMYTNIAPQYDEWLAVRMPVWLAATASEIADFTDGSGVQYSVKNFWSSYGYSSAARISNTDGNTNAGNYFNNTVVSQVALAKALEGSPSPMQRKYRASFITNYTFNKGALKGVSIGGSERWESKAALGFAGKVGDPTRPTVINLADVTRPYYDDGNDYTDLWISYSRKIFDDKVKMKVQLNCNNIFEDGGLQPINVNYDGSPWAFRIVDSRQFILTTSFEF